MSEAAQIADALASADEISGTLRFFGDWFGRPYDNVHRLTAAAAEDDAVTLRFHEDETLRIEKPRGLHLSPKARLVGGDDGPRMVIQSASRVRWEWFSYGLPKVAENRYFIEYVRTSDADVDRLTNWPTQAQDSRTVDTRAPVVELY